MALTKQRIGKLGGYAIALLVLSWLALTKAPALVDAANDGLVLIGFIVYILWVTAVATIGVDIVKTVKKINRRKK